MGDWPDGWREALIRDMGMERDDFLMLAFQKWQQSTPLQGYTNNPLGMPYKTGRYPQLLDSGYALFPTMRAFRAAFVEFLSTPEATRLVAALSVGQRWAPLYGAIHNLGWPASRTETDYPSAVLDMITGPVRGRLQSTATTDRKTSGIVGYTPASPSKSGMMGDAIRQSASTLMNAANAIRRINLGG